MFQTRVVEKIRTRNSCSITLFWKFVPFLWCNVEEYRRARQTSDDIVAHAFCMLDTRGYKHKLRSRNTCWFSTATLAARTRLIVRLDTHCVIFSNLICPLTSCLIQTFHKLFSCAVLVHSTDFLNVTSPPIVSHLLFRNSSVHICLSPNFGSIWRFSHDHSTGDILPCHSTWTYLLWHSVVSSDLEGISFDGQDFLPFLRFIPCECWVNLDSFPLLQQFINIFHLSLCNASSQDGVCGVVTRW